MLRELCGVPRYWFPYVFMEGKALPPTGIDIELTFRCNLKCQICPQERYKQRRKAAGIDLAKDVVPEIDTREIEALVEDVAALGVKLVTLTGGEPFLRPDLPQIVQIIKKRRLQCNILTNGLLVGENRAAEMVRAGVDTIIFSLDGPPQVHDRIRGARGAHERVFQAVRRIQEEKKKRGVSRPYLGLNCTISALNQTSFSHLVDIASTYQLASVNFGYLFFTDKQAIEKTSRLVEFQQAKEEDQVLPPDLWQIDVARFQAEKNTTQKKAAQAGVYISFTPNLKANEIEHYFYDANYAYCGKCFHPWISSRVNPYGDVYPCSIDLLMGSIRKTPFSLLWNNEKYRHFRKTLKLHKLFPKCHKCCNLNNKLWNYLY